jgi:Putative restriction endonuclease
MRQRQDREGVLRSWRLARRGRPSRGSAAYARCPSPAPAVTRCIHSATLTRRWAISSLMAVSADRLRAAGDPACRRGGARERGLAGGPWPRLGGPEEKPVALDDNSEPEPDLAVVPGTHRDYSTAHPVRPVVEVSESSLAWDRDEKGSLYARAGIGDYWIVNLIGRVLEVYRNPVPDPSAPHGWPYGSAESLAPPSTVSPRGLPGVAIPVAGMLP